MIIINTSDCYFESNRIVRKYRSILFTELHWTSTGKNKGKLYNVEPNSTQKGSGQINAHLHWKKTNAKANIFSFNFYRCSMPTLSWIPCKPIWKWFRICFSFGANINELLSVKSHPTVGNFIRLINFTSRKVSTKILFMF